MTSTNTNIEQIVLSSNDSLPGGSETYEQRERYKLFLSILEQEIGREKVDCFRKKVDSRWSGSEKDTSLFNLWQKVTQKVSLVTKEGTSHDTSLDQDQVLSANFIPDTCWDNTNFLEFDIQPDGSLVATTSLFQTEDVFSTGSKEKTPQKLICMDQPGTQSLKKNVEEGVCASTSSHSSYPTPFKKSLFWPETSIGTKAHKVKRKLTPTVAAAEEFLNYQRRIDEKKKK